MRGGVILNSITGRPEDEAGRPVGLMDLATAHLPSELRAHREVQMERVLEHLKMAKRSGAKGYSRNKHYVSVRTAASAATLRAVDCNLWNPHATSRIFLFEVWVFPTTAGSINYGQSRTTARGTVTTSQAMAINNSIENDSAAPSGSVVDTVWSVAPTLSAANLGQLITPAAIGNGVILPFPDPITIPAGTGFALFTTVAAAFPVSDVTFVFGD